MAELRVRPGRDAEIPEIGAMWLEMYVYQQAHGMLLPLRDDARELWERQLAGRVDTPTSVVLVAEDDEQQGLVGFLAAQTKRLPAHLTTTKSKVGFISETYVRPEARRHHVGRRLAEAAFAWFDRVDVGSIELHVLVENEVARAFWQSLGFVPELLQMRAMRR